VAGILIDVVLRLCLSANTLYAPGHVVDHGCNIPIESFVVHSSSIELVERGYREEIITLFLTFLSVMLLIHR
jgi:hypothetical protein